MRRNPQHFFALYFFLAAVAAVKVMGNDPASTDVTEPNGQPESISEWGLSGIVWSEANLVRKLAVETAKSDSSLSAEQRNELKRIAQRNQTLVEAMENFGWRRLQNSNSSKKADADPSSEGNSDGKGLPSPEQVGQQLAKSMGLKPSDKQSKTRKQVESRPRKKITEQYDTQTPAGKDDPGIDDELTPSEINVDIDQYRVDDYVDETPREARNMADAREDGVEAAIAAAKPDGIAGMDAGDISYRETQTRSATLPFSGSIYDAGDFDPDADYIIDNPLTGPGSDVALDGDDEISARKPALAAEGEDELLAAMERGGTRDIDREANNKEPMDRYSTRRFNSTKSDRSGDANWVSLHLELNENRWFAAQRSGLTFNDVLNAEQRLITTVRTVGAVSDSDRLKQLLGTN